MTKALATLVVYAYSSFTSSWGAGPEIIKNFEKKCGCQVVLVNTGDAGAMINRIKLEGKKSKADVVLGIDGAFLWRLKSDLGWNVRSQVFDHSPLAFIYNSKNVTSLLPTSLDDLLKSQWKNQIIIEDPRLSTTGLGFLLWVIKDRGELEAWKYFAKLKKQIKVVTPSWDLAYGLFKKDQAELVLSYWTSPAYHIQVENNENFKALAFTNGNYEQVEYVTINPESREKKLAQQFLSYLNSVDVQKLIPNKNFMYPASDKVILTPAFEKLGKVKISKPLDQNLIQEKLNTWLQKWREIFS